MILGDLVLRDLFVKVFKWNPEDLEDVQWAQCKLRPSSGGMGIIDVPAVALVAFTASSAATESFSNTIIRSNDTHSGASAVRLLQEMDDQISKFPEARNFVKTYGDNDVENENTLKPKLQSQLYQKRDLLQLLVLRNENPERAVRIDSSGEEGGTLVTAIPLSGSGAVFPPEVFQALVALRLGKPFITEGLTCVACHGAMDCHGRHVLSQCKMGNYRTVRHGAVQKELADFLRAAGYALNTESPCELAGSSINAMRMDIRVPGFEASKSLNLDISITDPRSLNVSKKVPSPGAAAKAREDQKIRKYGKELDPAITIFFPFVMELFGRWGTKTRYIFKKIVRLWCDREGLSVSIISHRWKTLLTSQMMLVGMREALHKKSLAVREYTGDNAGVDHGSNGDSEE